jgi:hypothetical protein
LSELGLDERRRTVGPSGSVLNSVSAISDRSIAHNVSKNVAWSRSEGRTRDCKRIATRYSRSRAGATPNTRATASMASGSIASVSASASADLAKPERSLLNAQRADDLVANDRDQRPIELPASGACVQSTGGLRADSVALLCNCGEQSR